MHDQVYVTTVSIKQVCIHMPRTTTTPCDMSLNEAIHTALVELTVSVAKGVKSELCFSFELFWWSSLNSQLRM